MRLEDIVELQNTAFITHFKEIMHKAHNNVHLVRVMRLLGPPVGYWSMPYERKNQDVTIVAAGTTSNKQKAYSIGVRNQLYMSHNKLCCDSVSTYYSVGPVENYDAEDEFRQLNPNIRGDLMSCKSFKHIKYFGKKLVSGMVIITKIDNDGLGFETILKIYEAKKNIYLHVQNLINIGFDSYYHAYEVDRTYDEKNQSLIHIDKVSKFDPGLLVKKKEGLFVALRYEI